MEQAVIYKLTCINNSKIYIGKTLKRRFTKRMSEHNRNPNNKMKNDIQKFGWDSFTKEILFESDEDICYDKEIELISELKPEYNTAPGGYFGNSGIKGEEHWNSKMTESLVLEMRDMAETKKYTNNEIADYFNLNRRQTDAIICGEAWREAGGPIQQKRIFLGEERAKEIRELFAAGEYTRQELKIMFDITEVGKILTGETYKEAGGPIADKETRKITDKEAKEIRYLFDIGEYTRDNLATKFLLSRSYISMILNGDVYGDADGKILVAKRKLKKNEVIELRNMAKDGVSTTELMKIFGKNRSCINNVISGRSFNKEGWGPISVIDYKRKR